MVKRLHFSEYTELTLEMVEEILELASEKNKYLDRLLDRISRDTFEEIKKEIGTVYNANNKDKISVKGRGLINGLPKTISISQLEVEEALNESIYEIIRVIKQVLENTPPELSADIINNGIVLTGGGSLLPGIDNLLKEELDIDVRLADSPLTCVAEGTGVMLSNLQLLNN